MITSNKIAVGIGYSLGPVYMSLYAFHLGQVISAVLG